MALIDSSKPGAKVVVHREELSSLFGSLRSDTTWNAIWVALSRMKAPAARMKVSLSASRPRQYIEIKAGSPKSLLHFAGLLESNRRGGRIQRSLANLIVSRTTDPAQLGRFGSFVRSQRKCLGSAYLNPLSLLLGSKGVQRSIFVDPPFATAEIAHERQSAAGYLAEQIRHRNGRSVFVIGPSGVGKSTFLGSVFAMLGESSISGETGFVPVFVPATAIQPDDSKGPIQWNLVPGRADGIERNIEALLEEGRLLLFIDGLDENVMLADFQNPTIRSFWNAASRNRCVLSCRDQFYSRFYLHSPLERLLGTGIGRMTLLDWTPTHAKGLYLRLSQLYPSNRHGLASDIHRLAELPVGFLANALKNVRLTALSAWAYAVFFISEKGGKPPRNEYELLEYVVKFLFRWEKTKGLRLDPEEGFGLLRKLAWKAYLQGNHGDTWNLTPLEFYAILGRHYPHLESRKSDILAALFETPLMEYHGRTGTFSIERHIGCFLVGSFFLDTVLLGNRDEVLEMFKKSLVYNCQVYLNQGISLLSPKDSARYLDVSKLLFMNIEELRSKDRAFTLEGTMAAVLQPLGYVRDPAAQAFLLTALNQTSCVTEFMRQCVAIGLAYGGDSGALRDYVARLKTIPSSGAFNRTFYLYYMRRDKSKWNIEDFDEKKHSDWASLCDWLLATIPSLDFTPLRPLHLFTLADFVQRKGPQPFFEDGEASGDRRKRLNFLIDAVSRDANVMNDPECRRGLKLLAEMVKNNGGSINGNTRSRKRKDVEACV